jgi:hypothetical protein
MMFLTIGLITFCMAIMRRKNRDMAMLFFSAMSIFFGLRYMFNTYSCLAIPLVIVYSDPFLVTEISNILVIICLIVLVANILNPRIRRKNDLRGLLIAIQQELDIARGIQLSIFPRQAPVTKELTIASRYVPMAAREKC